MKYCNYAIINTSIDTAQKPVTMKALQCNVSKYKKTAHEIQKHVDHCITAKWLLPVYVPPIGVKYVALVPSQPKPKPIIPES